ncbi:MAG: HpaII family restriction endonuclease [Paludibacteraceae bacterium]|jgi:type II restriction enzyme|nr:HpaII family restriction endonuclease [Paludibacteraceae bacterium]
MANIGEWSELYALFQILGEGKIHAGDAKLNKISTCYPILHALRNDIVNDYEVDSERKVIITHGGKSVTIPMKTFLDEASSLLQHLQSEKGRSFNIPTTQAFMETIGCSKIKAPATNKADIELIIHDPVTSMINQLGFSIKSQLGSSSTLLNASKATNFVYRIVGEMNTNQMNEINSIPEHMDRVAAIFSTGHSLKYDHMGNPQFYANLLFIASDLPQIIAECLIEDSLTSGGDLNKILGDVANRNPCKYPTSNYKAIYENRIKQLLISSALGMMPSKPWDGYYTAPGGYIIVKTNGDVICYHFYNRNLLEDYLYFNTKFERGGRHKHDFGEIYQINNEFYFKLNLQIRFLV